MTLVIFEGRLGWYWRLVAGNNRPIAIGAEPFSSKAAARRALDRVRRLFFICGDSEIGSDNLPLVVAPRARRKVRR